MNPETYIPKVQPDIFAKARTMLENLELDPETMKVTLYTKPSGPYLLMFDLPEVLTPRDISAMSMPEYASYRTGLLEWARGHAQG